jgi:hypothetical protein
MDHTDAEYLAILKDALPQEFLRALLRSVVTAHRAAFSQTKRHFDNPASRHMLLGHVRREKLNEEALALGERFKMNVRMEPYGRGSGYYLLVSSKRIFLVICVTQNRTTMVRPAEYRQILARQNENPQHKFAFMPDNSHAEGGQFLCILIHGRRRGKDYPAFADIAFPHKTFAYWMCRLNLFQEFPEIVDRLIVQRDAEARPGHRKTQKRRSA